MKKKIEFYGDIQNEASVIMAFSKIHEILGFNKLLPSSAHGFDVPAIEYHNEIVTVEFEYLSSNFIVHGHPDQMDNSNKYVVICWEDDCGLISKLKTDFNKELHDLIEIRNYVTIRRDFIEGSKSKPPQYVILAYNPDEASGKDFSAWAFANCYRVKTSVSNPKFAKDQLPPGSKILFYRKGYIIGGFTVVRYEVIDEPKDIKTLSLYKKLTDYPASLFTIDIEEYKEIFYRGHIFYTDFFDARDFKIRLDSFIYKKMSNHGKINISKEEYYRISGH